MPIVEMNLIDKLEVQDGVVNIEYHATTPYCPPIFALKISQDMKTYALQAKGVKDVKVTVKGHYLADAVNKQVNKPQTPQAQPAQPQPTQPK
jgi:metal-sulfur cluster biosynthetic enzyme